RVDAQRGGVDRCDGELADPHREGAVDQLGGGIVDTATAVAEHRVARTHGLHGLTVELGGERALALDAGEDRFQVRVAEHGVAFEHDLVDGGGFVHGVDQPHGHGGGGL